MADAHTKFLLSEDQIPTHWVNLLPDLPGDPLPPRPDIAAVIHEHVVIVQVAMDRRPRHSSGRRVRRSSGVSVGRPSSGIHSRTAALAPAL